MIDGVKITPLKQIPDERGVVLHMLRSDWDVFQDFGEIYFSCIYPGAVKAWNNHKRMTLNLAVPWGRIKLVLYDDRKESPSQGEIQELFLGPGNYQLVTVPPCVWVGFCCIGQETAVMANCASIPHDPDEVDRCDPFDNSIPYDWRIERP